ncbi:MAG: glycine cleavage system aminomethyltransferase GcvT [Capsulimonadaceae bacterium]|nr:glycine cleavage system aminomethyltransferase GcvT [Capsulimonadaceae bacterium]
MKSTALIETHRALGARFVDYAGWEMPVQYSSGPVAEVKACRSAVGIFDVSHMGTVRVSGPEALDFIQYVTSNDASRLVPGQAQYSLLLNGAGGVVDDIIVYRVATQEFFAVINAGCKDKDVAWLRTHIRSFPGATLVDESDATSIIAVQGPSAVSLVSSLTAGAVDSIKRFHFASTRVSGVSLVAAHTGYTGEDGFELIMPWDGAPSVWSALIAGGASPCGLASRDVLRIEAAYPLYGHEINEDISPLGAGLQWAVKTSKKDFIGRNALVERAQSVTREKLVGLVVASGARAIPRERCPVYASTIEDPVGIVTSGTLSPTLGIGVALARVGAGWATMGQALEIDIRGKRSPVEVAPLPFYRNGV